MAKTIEQLKAQGAEVKNATVVGENTATRVGTLFNDIVEHVEDYEAKQAERDTKQDNDTASLVNAEKERAMAAEEANATSIIGTDRLADNSVTYDKLQEEIKEVAECINYTENPEFIYVKTDADGRLLWWINTDGSVGWAKGVPLPVQEELKKLEQLINDNLTGDEQLKERVAANEAAIVVINETLDKKVDGVYEDNPEFIKVEKDADGRIISNIYPDGSHYIYNLQSETIPDEFSDSNDLEERVSIVTDKDDRILSYRDKTGKLYEPAGIKTSSLSVENLSLSAKAVVDLQKSLKDNGILGGVGDWSDYISSDGDNPLYLNTPKCSFVNIITDRNLAELGKIGLEGNIKGVHYDVSAQIEFWDMQGNYFKKKALISGQGRATLAYPKKNIAIDLFDNEINGDSFSIKFGDWVPQDSFHLKAYYDDPLRCKGVITYKIWDEILKSRGNLNDYYWKKALLDSNISSTSTNALSSEDVLSQFYTGAKCVPDGFPCVVYWTHIDKDSGIVKTEFWGIYNWQLKKHRDNYNLDKKNPNHIHLDGVVGTGFWTANGDASKINWDATDVWDGIEIKNPKSDTKASKSYLFLQKDGTPYDADINAGEIMGADSEYYDENNKNHIVCANVKSNILNITTILPSLKKLRSRYNDSQNEDEKIEILSEIKRIFESSFDVDNLIDYLILSDITYNWDGFYSNWQWVTYDGKRWYCCLYDTNSTFGHKPSSSEFYEPINHHCNTDLMMRYIVDFYNSELENRYAELRDNGIIDAEHIVKLFTDYMSVFPKELFEKEYSKWQNSYINDSIPRLYKWIREEIQNMDKLYKYNNK